jgi:hypothetical protein
VVSYYTVVGEKGKCEVESRKLKVKRNEELTQRSPSAQRTQRGRRKGINTEAAERTEDTERKKKGN